MKLLATFLIVFCLLCEWSIAFVHQPGRNSLLSRRTHPLVCAPTTKTSSWQIAAKLANCHEQDEAPTIRISPSLSSKKTAISLIAIPTGVLFGIVGAAVAATEDVEIAELPPPWVPAIFAVGLLAGVGILTSSLGDVMSEESSLGMQSGARAKKEIERSRSSYFKKR